MDLWCSNVPRDYRKPAKQKTRSKHLGGLPGTAKKIDETGWRHHIQLPMFDLSYRLVTKKMVGGFTVGVFSWHPAIPNHFPLLGGGFTTSQKLFVGTQDSVHFWIGQFLGIRSQRAGSSPLFQSWTRISKDASCLTIGLYMELKSHGYPTRWGRLGGTRCELSFLTTSCHMIGLYDLFFWPF